jgi:hypothetical protein
VKPGQQATRKMHLHNEKLTVANPLLVDALLRQGDQIGRLFFSVFVARIYRILHPTNEDAEPDRLGDCLLWADF